MRRIDGDLVPVGMFERLTRSYDRSFRDAGSTSNTKFSSNTNMRKRKSK
jgi:hypothetical protein